jgi:hypothetical protein
MKYKVFNVGGDPDEDFCIAEHLQRLLDNLQNNGFRVERIDYHEISSAWSFNEQTYKKTSEYIILATESEE